MERPGASVRAVFLMCLLLGTAGIVFSGSILAMCGAILMLLAFYVRLPQVEAEQYIRGFAVATERLPVLAQEVFVRAMKELAQQRKDRTVIQEGERIFRIGRDC